MSISRCTLTEATSHDQQQEMLKELKSIDHDTDFDLTLSDNATPCKPWSIVFWLLQMGVRPQPATCVTPSVKNFLGTQLLICTWTLSW